MASLGQAELPAGKLRFSPELEAGYRQFYYRADAKRAVMVNLCLFIPQLALILNDRQIVASDTTFGVLVALRVTWCLLSIGTTGILLNNRDPRVYDGIVGGLIIFGVAALAFIGSTRPIAPIGFFITGVLLVSVFYFVLPGSLWYRTLGAAGVSLILAQTPFESATPWHLQNHLIPLLIFHILAFPVAVQEERFRRLRFLSHLDQEAAKAEIRNQATALEEARSELAALNADLERRLEAGLLELRRTNQSLALANQELLRADRAKGDFLAAVSHELRTPLNAVLTYGEALMEGVYDPLTARQQAPMRTIRESAQHLSSMIDDLLDLARIEAGAAQLELQSVSLDEILHAAARMVSGEAQHKRLQLVVRSSIADVEADPRRLMQIVLNLLSNAVKFTPDGGRVELSCDPVDDDFLRIGVRDTGIGIAAEDQARVFEPFVQLDSGLTRQHAGTGLGLLLVRDLARLHGGSVGLQSELGKGSYFFVDLPRAPAGRATTSTAERR